MMRQSSILDVGCHQGRFEELEALIFVHANANEAVDKTNLMASEIPVEMSASRRKSV